MGAPSITDEFVWTNERSEAALLLAQGHNKAEVGRRVGVARETVSRWSFIDEFAEEVDRLSLVYGVGSKAYRLRMINQAVRQKMENDKIDLTGVTFIDLIKEARMQTEGIRLGILDKLISADEEAGSVAGGGPKRSLSLPEPEAEETE